MSRIPRPALRSTCGRTARSCRQYSGHRSLPGLYVIWITLLDCVVNITIFSTAAHLPRLPPHEAALGPIEGGFHGSSAQSPVPVISRQRPDADRRQDRVGDRVLASRVVLR